MGDHSSKHRRREQDSVDDEVHKQKRIKNFQDLRLKVSVKASSPRPNSDDWEEAQRALNVYMESPEPCEDPLLAYVFASVIGKDRIVQMPYGDRELIYCDYTSAGKSLRFIEEFLTDNVLSLCGGATAADNSYISRQMSTYCRDARQHIRTTFKVVDSDQMIFTANSQPFACKTLARALPQKNVEKTTIITGPYLSDTVQQAWKDCGFTVLRCRESKQGVLNLVDLQDKIKGARETGNDVVCHVSAASSCTGILTDMDAVARVVHREGAMLFADFFTAGPYVKTEMRKDKLCYLDAMFVSVEKFVGGATCPGLLVLRGESFPPRRSHGDEMTHEAQPQKVATLDQYLDRSTHMAGILMAHPGKTSQAGSAWEEDTSAVHAIRSSLVLHLKDAVGCDLIQRKHDEFLGQALTVWRKNPNLYILGSKQAHRLPIFSFLVRHPGTGKFLHHNFVATLLSDLYGIQARGVTCSGRHERDLLNIGEVMAEKFQKLATGTCKRNSGSEDEMAVLKPGFVRLNLPYFFDDATVHHVIEAVDMVAKHGWMLLPEYTLDPMTGAYRHLGSVINRIQPKLYSLSGVRYEERGLVFKHPPLPKTFPPLSRMSDEALEAVRLAPEQAKKVPTDVIARAEKEVLSRMTPRDRLLIWFLLPSEALQLVLRPNEAQVDRTRVPFLPRQISRQPRLSSIKKQARQFHKSHSYDHDIDPYLEPVARALPQLPEAVYSVVGTAV